MSERVVRSRWTKADCQELLAFVPDAALIIDSQGIILAANEEASRVLGYANEELCEQSLNNLLPESLIEAHRQHLRYYFQNPQHRPMGEGFALTARHKEGHEIAVAISLAPWKLEEKRVVTAVIRDITHRKQMEATLAEKQKQLENLINHKITELRDSNEALRSQINERQRLEEQLRQMSVELTQRQELLRGEMTSLEAYSQNLPSAITSQVFNLHPLSTSLPFLFAELSAHYSELLDITVDKKVYKTERDPSDGLRTIANQLGFLNATPQDVVLLHSQVLKEKIASVSHAKADAYFVEGRLLVLKLMGYLAAHYRNYSLHFLQNAASSRFTEPRNLSSPDSTPYQDTHPKRPFQTED